MTGSVVARPDTLDEAIAYSRAHVERSRREPGCLLHSVHRDVENPLRLVFVEHWADAEALRAHFAVPASNDFVRAISALASEPPELAIYEAQPLRI